MKFPEKDVKTIENSTEYWNPEKENDKIVGILTSVNKEGLYGPTYFINTGDRVIGTPSHKILQNMLSQVPLGDIVEVTYLGIGEAKKGQNAPALYLVRHAKA